MKKKLIGRLYYNRDGVDECYGFVEGNSVKEIIKGLCDKVGISKGCEEKYRKEEEYSNSKVECWVYDGMGIYIGEDDNEIEECVERG